MARTTTANNQLGTFNAQGGQAFNNAQTDLSTYNSNLGKLNAGMNVGADPFKSTAYLSNQNKLQSEALNTAADSGKAALQRSNIASGGLNRSQNTLAQRDIGLQTGRLADTLSAQRASNDYKANLQWQQYLAGAPLAGAQLQTGLYSTATGGSGNALNNYTTAMDDTYNNLTQLGSSAMMAAGMAAGCPVLGTLYKMADGSKKPVEQLRLGDLLLGIDGEPELIEEIQSARAPVVRITTDSGIAVRNSATHAFALPRGGFTVAARCLGMSIKTDTKLGSTRVTAVTPDGEDWVFNVMTNRTHTYCADGLWAYGVGDAERHVGMNEWAEVGKAMLAEVAQ